jgi:hypothetical protein
MSSVCILTPIVVGSWPMIASAIAGAAGAMGFTVLTGEREPPRTGRTTVESEVPHSEVVAETLARGETIRIEREGVTIAFGVDERGKCTVCASGQGRGKAELKQIAEEVSGRIVQQFAYHKLMTELKARGFAIEEETIERDQSIRIRVVAGR